MSKFVETYLKWKLPLKKYGMIPKYSFLEDASACQILVLPSENFYDKVEEGSIILRKPKGFSFCKEGVIIDGEIEPLKTDLVILATGYKGDEKLKNIFYSPSFQKRIMGSPTSILPLYRSFQFLVLLIFSFETLVPLFSIISVNLLHYELSCNVIHLSISCL